MLLLFAILVVLLSIATVAVFSRREEGGTEEAKRRTEGAKKGRWSWLDVDEDHPTARRGKYASEPMNQHRDEWCGACYLVATVQAVQDHMNIRDSSSVRGSGRGGDRKEDCRVYEFDLQEALDTFTRLNGAKMRERSREGIQLSSRGGGSLQSWDGCKGGDPADVLRFLSDGSMKLKLERKSRGLTWASRVGEGSRMDSPHGHGIRGFRMIEPPRLESIRSSLYERGPIVAAVCSSPLWTLSDKGVVTEDGQGERDHVVVLLGWEEIDGDVHWIARNSWADGSGSTSVKKACPDCSEVRMAWRTGEDVGCFSFPASESRNSLGLYDSPSGLYEIHV